ncbi:MAG: 6-bladed beta-propeller [Bacteroidota bacterium]
MKELQPFRIHPLTFALIALIFGCKDKFYDSQSTHLTEVGISYKVDPGNATEANLSDLVAEVEYTRLKLPPEIFFSQTLKVIHHNDHFYFLDQLPRSTEAKIFCFDQSGNFKYVIDEMGHGPGEYTGIQDFDVTDEYVIIYAAQNGDFLFYNNESGQFVKSMDRANLSSSSFSVLDGNTILMEAGRFEHNKPKTQLKVYDMEAKDVIYEDVPFNNPSLKMSHIYRYTFTARDTVSTLPMYSQIVYRAYKQDGSYLIKPAYELDFGDYWIPNHILANSYKNRNQFFDSYKDFVNTAEVFETDHIIYAYYQLHGENHTFIHDRRTDKSLDVTSFNDNSIGWLGKPLATQGDWVVNLVAPFEIEDAGIKPNGQLKEILDQTTDEGQPILVKVKFKVE